MSGCAGKPERCIKGLDTLADVSQARAVGGLCRVKPSTVVCDARGQRSMAVTQAELDLRGAAIAGRVKVSAHVSDLGAGWARLDGQLAIDSLRNFAFGHFRSTSGLRMSNAGTPPRP